MAAEITGCGINDPAIVNESQNDSKDSSDSVLSASRIVVQE